MLDAKGNTKVLSDSEINRLQMQYGVLYEVCERHKIVCYGKKAFSLHLQEEHAY